MVFYRIIHHIPGCIKIEVPAIRKLSLTGLLKISKQISISTPSGIKDIRPNPFSSSLVITYEPEKINIIEYLEKTASNPEIKKLIGG